jgi:putative addiction module component (TIGR02574 family)
MVFAMSIEEIHIEALRLPEDQRAKLAGALLASLPVLLAETDDDMAEAQRRSDELRSDPEGGMTWEEVKANLDRQA